MHACIAQDNVYADIHLSKAHYTTADAPLFQSILKNIRLQPEPSKIIQAKLPAPPRIIQIYPPAPPNSRELLEIGNVLYRQNKFAQAISPYSNAFDLETAEPQLDRTLQPFAIARISILATRACPTHARTHPFSPS